MDITIKYNNGQMLIHLEELVSEGSIVRFRKILKLIRWSHTPECEEKIKDFIKGKLDSFDQESIRLEHIIKQYEASAGIYKTRVEFARRNRDQYKRSTPLHKSEPWEQWNEEMKQMKENLHEQKILLSSYQLDYNKAKKENVFCRKALEELRWEDAL